MKTESPAIPKIQDRYFEDVQVGDVIAPMIKKPDEVQLFCFSAVTWDTHRTHFDHPFSVNVDRLPGILVHGHLQGAFLGQLATAWAAARGRLLFLGYQNRGMSVPGDTLTCTGKVAGKREDAGKGVVTCQVWVENQKGQMTTTGEAIIELPRRGKWAAEPSLLHDP